MKGNETRTDDIQYTLLQTFFPSNLYSKLTYTLLKYFIGKIRNDEIQ